jgi:hypothetical protein
MPDINITAIVETFVSQIAAAVEAAMVGRVQAALGIPQKRKPGRPAKHAVALVAPVAGRKAAGKKAKKVSAKVARARKLQGRYLGALRALSAEDGAKVKAVAKERGVAAAVKMAAGMKKV